MGESGNILVVDDEPQICRVLQITLLTQGYEVWDAGSGSEALDFIRSGKFDLILLDLNLPDKQGADLCREIRAATDAAIIVLSVRNSESDKVAALDAGADDYVTKPFDSSELLARIRANLRRQSAKEVGDLFTSEDFVIDFAARTVSRHGNEMRLPPKQFQLLRYLVSRRGKPLSHRTLLEAVWGKDFQGETGLLQPVIMQIRKKIEPDPARPRYLVTIPWFGYQFNPPTEEFYAEGNPQI